MTMPSSVDQVLALLQGQGYVGNRRLATSVHLALALKRPLFLEGEPGVGKTELAKVLSRAMDAPLIRLQCYEGLDLSQAAYEWNVARQMMEIRLAEAAQAVNDGAQRQALERSLYRREMLLELSLIHI